MSIFDIMGPVMIGPSSSHTAGAVKIGQIAQKLFKNKLKKVNIIFYGSFAETYRGHGTDKALVGGILGLNLSDRKIVNSLKLARKRGIDITINTSFEENNTGIENIHPNTAKVILANDNKDIEVIGSSIGGGNIEVSMINEFEVKLTGKNPTLWCLHKDRPGLVAEITAVLGNNNLNITYMKVTHNTIKNNMLGSSVIELESRVSEQVVKELNSKKDILKVRHIPEIQE